MSRWDTPASDGEVLDRFKRALANALDEQFETSEGDYGERFERQFAVVHGSPYGAASNIRTVLLEVACRHEMALALEHLLLAAAEVPIEYGAWQSYRDTAAKAVGQALEHHPAIRLRLAMIGNSYEIHPAGASDLDDGVVEHTVTWLARHPAIQQHARRALSSCATGDAPEGLNAACIALEMLVRVVTNNSKSLENQIGASASAAAPLPDWFRRHGVKPHVITMAYRIVSSVADFQNAWVKHPPAAGVTFESAEVQFELYAVFNLMYLLAEVAG